LAIPTMISAFIIKATAKAASFDEISAFIIVSRLEVWLSRCIGALAADRPRANR
jgi:hypothetical protein